MDDSLSETNIWKIIATVFIIIVGILFLNIILRNYNNYKFPSQIFNLFIDSLKQLFTGIQANEPNKTTTSTIRTSLHSNILNDTVENNTQTTETNTDGTQANYIHTYSNGDFSIDSGINSSSNSSSNLSINSDINSDINSGTDSSTQTTDTNTMGTQTYKIKKVKIKRFREARKNKLINRVKKSYKKYPREVDIDEIIKKHNDDIKKFDEEFKKFTEEFNNNNGFSFKPIKPELEKKLSSRDLSSEDSFKSLNEYISDVGLENRESTATEEAILDEFDDIEFDNIPIYDEFIPLDPDDVPVKHPITGQLFSKKLLIAAGLSIGLIGAMIAIPMLFTTIPAITPTAIIPTAAIPAAGIPAISAPAAVVATAAAATPAVASVTPEILPVGTILNKINNYINRRAPTAAPVVVPAVLPAAPPVAQGVQQIIINDSGGGAMMYPKDLESFPKFIGYWKEASSFCIKDNENNENILDCVPTEESILKIGNSFSKSFATAQQRGHKFMAIQRDTNFKNKEPIKRKKNEIGGKMLSFNQLNYTKKNDYNYLLPSEDQKDKNAGCTLEVCKEIYDLTTELWAVYQLYK